MTLEERIQLARELHAKGYICSQCVTLAFPDLTTPLISSDVLGALTAAFGGGVGGSREMCGAISGMAALEGLLHYNSPADKRPVYATTKGLVDDFRRINGSVMCRELRVPGGKPCMLLIEDAITLLHNRLSSK